MRTYSVCDVCGRGRTRVACAICERMVCFNCHYAAGHQNFSPQPGDRVCSRRCRRQYKMDRREDYTPVVSKSARQIGMRVFSRADGTDVD